ncbi:MAG: phosphatase PAP2 family protein [Candidatus Gracilibacteria bacterium]|nr:phosphatase PAP2 family protein [Candidatus Gracilibacteria bacterium]
MQEINEQILIYLNGLIDNKIVENIALFFADSPIFILPLFLFIGWLYYTYKIKDDEKKKELLFIFYSSIVALIINLIIQKMFHFDRPETVLKGVGKLLLNHIPDASFPSDHAAVSISFLTALFLANYKKIAYILIIPFALMNISRVILGVHWPFDIVVGAIIGVIGAFISFKGLKKCDLILKLNNLILKIMNYIKM